MSLKSRCILKTGSRWTVSEFGAPDGRPFFYFHGFPGSRLEAELADRCARHQQIRLIAVDRPGYGETPFRIRNSIAGWHADVTGLADHYGLERFGVMGVSGGGPYALACACFLPNRVSVAGLVCALGPTNRTEVIKEMPFLQRFGLTIAIHSPYLIMPLFYFLMILLSFKPALFLSHLSHTTGPADKAALQDDKLRTVLTRSVKEALVAGPRGAWWDLKLYARPWGFALSDVQVPVYLWHGGADHVITASMGRMLTQSLPNCKSHFLAEEGHFSLICNHMHTIVATLARAHDAAVGKHGSTHASK